MIPLWGCAKPCWIKDMQKLQNQAGRYVLKCNRYMKVSAILSGCNWLSIVQLIRFHSLLLLWRTVRTDGWSTLQNGLSLDHSNQLDQGHRRILLTRYSWKFRSIGWWNELPAQLRNLRTITTFKASLRVWILGNTRLKL